MSDRLYVKRLDDATRQLIDDYRLVKRLAESRRTSNRLLARTRAERFFARMNSFGLRPNEKYYGK